MALKALFRVRLLGFKGVLTGANRSRKKRSRAQLIGFAVLMLYTFGYFAVMLYGTFHALAGPLSQAGLGAAYFALAGAICFSLMFFGSIFTAKAQLYEATDNDLLLSMPIRPNDILLSRMFLLLVLDWIFGLMAAGPALFAWFQAVGVQAGPLLACLLVFLVLLPGLALMLSALFGWLLHLASSRARNQSLITVVLSLAFVALYMVAISRFNEWINAVAADPSPLADALGSVAPLMWIGRACADGELAALGALVLITAGVVLLGWVALTRNFIRAATDRRGAKKIRYVERAAEVLSPERALLRRELKRFFSCPGYLLNAGFGLMVLPLAAVYLLFRRDMLAMAAAQPGIGALLPMMLLFALCFAAATAFITAPSISLEGKSLWLLQSLPVTPRQVLAAKLRTQLLVGLPPLLFSGAVLAAVLRPGPLMSACFLAVPAAALLFGGLLGLFENLRHPNFDWLNETQAVKTGVSGLFTMLLGWVALMPALVLFIVFGDAVPPAAFALGLLALYLLLSLLLQRWLRRRGEALFCSL